MVLCLGLPALVAAAPLSVNTAQVVDAAKFTYEIAEVAFEQPLNLSTGAGVTSRLDLIKVVVHGEGFRPMATGPIVWLNGIPTLRTEVAEDGTSVTAYFLESLPDLHGAATQRGHWELLYQPHEGASEVYRVSPTGHAADAGREPAISQLSAVERQRVETLRQQLGLQ
jgi:hypothetical protein